MFLHVRCQLFSMGLLQCFNCLIVSLEISELLFVVLDPSVKSALQLLDLTFEVTNFTLVFGFQRLLLSQQSFLVLHELLLAFPL